MKRWYVAQTLVRSEETARLNLDRQGFEPYLPRYLRERRHARRREVVKALLARGADPRGGNKWDLTAADWAQWPANSAEVLALLHARSV